MYNITMMPTWFYLPNRLLQRSHTEYNCNACSNYGDREEKGKVNNIKVNAIYVEKLKKTNQARKKCFHTYVLLEKVFLPKTTHKKKVKMQNWPFNFHCFSFQSFNFQFC